MPIRNLVAWQAPPEPGQYWCRPWGEKWQVVRVDFFQYGPFEKRAVYEMKLGYQKQGEPAWWLIGDSETWGPAAELPEELRERE